VWQIKERNEEMLTPSESNDLLRGSFQLDSSSKNYDQLGCWDLSTLLSLPINQSASVEINSNGTHSAEVSKETLEAWSDPDWNAYKFNEPNTIPRCWDVSSLY
jgi:hypothetical protein